MKYILAVLIAFAGLFSTVPAGAQSMDVTAFITSPQAGETGLEGRTFGYGVGATYVHPCDEVFSIVATIQYHNHNRAEVVMENLEWIQGHDRDFVTGAGVRIEKWGLYGQGLAGFTQKRDALIDKENDTKPSGMAGFGFQPGRVGFVALWYFSDFGTQYSAGFSLRL